MVDCMSVKNFQDLLVWQKAMDFTEAVHGIVKLLPKAELYELCSQKGLLLAVYAAAG